MKIKVKNRYHNELKLIDFGVTVKPNEIIEVIASEKQIECIRNTHELEIIEDDLKEYYKKGE